MHPWIHGSAAGAAARAAAGAAAGAAASAAAVCKGHAVALELSKHVVHSRTFAKSSTSSTVDNMFS